MLRQKHLINPYSGFGGTVFKVRPFCGLVNRVDACYRRLDVCLAQTVM